MNLPSALIFVNNDVDGYTIATLASQLYLDGYISKTEFDARVLSLPSYVDILHANGLRLLVILPDFRDYVNRDLADVVMFYKQGMVSILKNKFGPPNLTLPVQRLNVYALLRAVGSTAVVILPAAPNRRQPFPCDCNDKFQQPFPCDCGKILGGIFAIQASDTTGVHLPNCNNEFSNEAFINRK